MTTLLTARTTLRTMLREPTANIWADARLNQCISDSNVETFSKMGRVRDGGWDQIQESVTLLANASSFSLTVGSLPTALTKTLRAIAFIEHQGTSGFWNLCEELREGDEFRFRAINAVTATGDVPPKYRLRRPNIICLPISAADRTLRITYRYSPVALTGDSDVLDVPDERVPLVLARAKLFALEDTGEVDDVTVMTFQKLEDEMYEDLAHPDGEGRALTVKPVEGPSVFAF